MLPHHRQRARALSPKHVELGIYAEDPKLTAEGGRRLNTREYLDSLFADYQETPALDDFKEELRGFLDERIKNLVQTGMAQRDAFFQATSELGDMSAVADEISRKKKQEVLAEMYMRTRHYMPTSRIALYVSRFLPVSRVSLLWGLTQYAAVAGNFSR
ncbi:MAG: permease prefix domain 1-containing protein [Limnochordia bacterium]